MKKQFVFILLLISIYGIFAQSPHKFSYQAVIRNNNNNLVVNQTVGMLISILQGNINGNAVYIESHTSSTNDNGLLTLEIGNGSVISGIFDSIEWEIR